MYPSGWMRCIRVVGWDVSEWLDEIYPSCGWDVSERLEEIYPSCGWDVSERVDEVNPSCGWDVSEWLGWDLSELRMRCIRASEWGLSELWMRGIRVVGWDVSELGIGSIRVVDEMYLSEWLDEMYPNCGWDVSGRVVEVYPSCKWDVSEWFGWGLSELWMRSIRVVDEIYPSGWIEILPTSANDATVQGQSQHSPTQRNLST